MTQQKESVVTPDRFKSGLTYDEYVARIQRNREKFEYNYRETKLSNEDASAFRSLASRQEGPSKVLALGEDWCPDVFRGLPVMARIAETAGMELRIFPRDDNLDIMGEFLNRGESQSIPTFVFYTPDHRYIAHWIERPAKANAEMGEVMKRYEGLDRSNPDDLAKLRQLADEFQTGPVWALEEKSR
ncbi:MAG: thioredoxin family protein [Chloroflexi bacterium]|nr:MAG: thioredoxin family protein [Chloroflexota bacterium]